MPANGRVTVPEGRSLRIGRSFSEGERHRFAERQLLPLLPGLGEASLVQLLRRPLN